MENLVEKINKLKKEKNAIIIAHCYQNIEIDLVADYVGDSLGLSQLAKDSEADTIIFAGVYFMAQTAKILSPEKTVILPKLDAGCDMADMINPEKLTEFKKQNPDIPVVCYVNSTAEVKALCDFCCTSSNAIDVVKSIPSKKILFVPDKGLGGYIARNLPEKEIICYQGYCPVHMNVKLQSVINLKQKYPNALVISHPECKGEVIEHSDFCGSTMAMMNFVKNSNEKEFIIVTEIGVVERLKRDYPQKTFYHISKETICPDMKKISLNDIYTSLQNNYPQVELDEQIRQKAKICIERMLKVNV